MNQATKFHKRFSVKFKQLQAKYSTLSVRLFSREQELCSERKQRVVSA